jgi:hypothetical protein
MIPIVDTVGRGVVVYRPAALIQPRKQTCSRISHQFELNRPPGLLLNHHRSGSDFRTSDQSPDLDFHKIAASQFAVYRQIEQRPISQPSFSIKEEADGPDLSRLERSFCANFPACIPCGPCPKIGGVK